MFSLDRVKIITVNFTQTISYCFHIHFQILYRKLEEKKRGKRKENKSMTSKKTLTSKKMKNKKKEYIFNYASGTVQIKSYDPDGGWGLTKI